MKELITRSYQAILKRGLITDNTNKLDFIRKMYEELGEVNSNRWENHEKEYIEECTDLATVCIMQIHHLGYDFKKEFEKVVIKNETRKD
jgi:NTP pyrophosphatase (non-canonical NTP hydrolase)